MLSLGETYVAVRVAITTGRRVSDWSMTKLMIGLTKVRNELCGLRDAGIVPLTAVTEVLLVVWLPFSSDVAEPVIRFLGKSSRSRWYRDASMFAANAERNGSRG